MNQFKFCAILIAKAAILNIQTQRSNEDISLQEFIDYVSNERSEDFMTIEVKKDIEQIDKAFPPDE